MSVPAPKIVTCAQWGAKPPKTKPVVVSKPDKALVHHTDGHHPELGHAGESYDECVAYARALQALHMSPPRNWNDSGHNFLICRNGLIFQGRWGTVSAIEHGRMVESAHCPGQNGNPGVEFEHLPGEQLPREQIDAGIALYAWIFDRCHISPTALYGHHDFYNTDCPDNLYPLIMGWRAQIATAINKHGRNGAPVGRNRRAVRAVNREVKGGRTATAA